MSKTEIYGTLGPACQDEAVICSMFEAGMTGMRLNLSHSGLNACGEWLSHFHAGAEKAGLKPKLLIDLQGPELRVGDFLPCRLKEGEEAVLGAGGIPIPELIIEKMNPGQEILLDDGKLLLCAEASSGTGREGHVRCRVMRGGELKPRKSIAVPGLSLHPPTLTKSDRKNLFLAKKCGVTGVMLPFVRDAEDLRVLRRTLQEFDAGELEIFAKLENLEGVEKLPELIPEADMIVIARGDLGNAVPLWELPGLSHRIGGLCREAGVPYLVVTQMLASMEQSPVPTRAELSDIFYAVLQGAAAVMLTGETAAGKYPLEAMEYMCRVVREAECMRDDLD